MSAAVSPVTESKRPDYVRAIDFENDVTDVVIKHVHGAHVRASPENHELPDHKGGFTDWAKWIIHVVEPGNVVECALRTYEGIRLQNLKTKKYLRISKKADYVIIDDNGSQYSDFIIHKSTLEPSKVSGAADSMSPSPSADEVARPVVQLESRKFRGRFITVRPHEGLEITRKKCTHTNWFQILCRGKSPEDDMFTLPYMFEKENTVIIRDPHGGGVAVIEGALSALGTKASHSRWTAVPTKKGDASAASEDGSSDSSPLVEFRHIETEKWLTVTDEKKCVLSESQSEQTRFKVSVITEPNVVKLESAGIPGAFLSSREEGITIGKGGPHSQMTILRMS